MKYEYDALRGGLAWVVVDGETLYPHTYLNDQMQLKVIFAPDGTTKGVIDGKERILTRISYDDDNIEVSTS